MKEQNILKVFASYYYNLGFNVSCIHGEKTNHNKPPYSKNPYHEWEHLKTTRQQLSDTLNYDWESAIGIGAILGHNNIRAIDGCSSKEFLAEVLILLSLPTNYEWVVQSGSKNGFHIYFQSPSNEFFPNDGKVKAYKPDSQFENVFRKMEFRFYNHIILPPSIHSNSNKYTFLNVEIPLKEPRKLSISNIFKLIENVANLKSKSTYVELVEFDSEIVELEIEIPPEKESPNQYYIDDIEFRAFLQPEFKNSISRPKIPLQKPLIYFDTETTGQDRVNDRIIRLR